MEQTVWRPPIAPLDIIITIALGLLCFMAVLMTAVRLPGVWLIVALAAAHGWWSGWQPVSFTTIAILVGAAVLGEVVETLTSVFAARRAGASRRAAWGGLIGGFVGMIFLSIPVPLIGTVVGAVFGCFAGAAIGELSTRRELGQGAKVGLFAAIGFVIGGAVKTALAMAMSGWLMYVIIRYEPLAPL